jgi:DNA-binding NarL/FixJ family response regulator
VIYLAVIAPTLALRTGLRALLEADPDLDVIAEAARLESSHALPAEVDVVVMAIGASTRAELEQVLPDTLAYMGFVLMVEEGSDSNFLSKLPLRAWGLLPLDTSAEELTAAVCAVHEGLLVGSPPLLSPLLGRNLIVGETEPLIDPLTDRESEVLELIAQGLANKQIAVELDISEHTVKFHVSSLYSKLGATNRAEAVRIGARQGLIVL